MGSCGFPACNGATAGEAPMCSLHARVTVHGSYYDADRHHKRHQRDYESEEE